MSNIDATPFPGTIGNGNPAAEESLGTPATPPSPTGAPPASSSKPRGKVKLDVGGFNFTTSRGTLCRFPETFLEIMFSGRHEYPTEIDPDDGSYFIDRDGRHFHHILNFLRVGSVVSLPESNCARDELAAEADFYGLIDLVKAIHQPQVDIASRLAPETLRIREEENELRMAFANKSAQGYDIHHGLISLFASPEESSLVDSKWTAPLMYGRPELQADETLCMASLRRRTLEMKRGHATCKTMENFRTAFNSQHPNILNRIDDILREEPVVVAGGSVLRALTDGGYGTRTSDWWGGDSDIDLFIYGVEPEEANRISRRIFEAIAVDNERWGAMRSRGVINFHQSVNSNIAQKVQIVLRVYDAPTEILFGFDADCCCCAYDGRDVWLSKRCVLALETGMNILNPIHAWPNKASYEMRLAKYASRGFPVLVPGLDECRIDSKRLQQTDIGNLKGLARLLKISQEMESAASAVRRTGSSYNPPRGYETSLFKTDQIGALKKEGIVCRDDAEILANGGGWYDNIGPYNVLIPRVYFGVMEEPNGYQFWPECSEFPPSVTTRDEGWAELVECESPPEGVPGRLVDAWDTEKRSREYLNSKMDTFDLDNLYYSHAYKA